jgi:hypothetical protein
MSWFTNFEKSIAGKLHKAFTGAKELADHASDEVIKAEEALAAAKQKAADLTAEAHRAALAAVEKAKAETEALIAEAEAAAKRAEYHAGLVPAPQEPVAPTLEPVVEEAPAVDQGPVCSICKSSPCTCEHVTPQ